jgi:hypothetical protein
VATTIFDVDDDKQADSSNMERVTITVCSVKHQARPSIENFERLLKGACPNDVYPIKHKLKDYGMMKSFNISESLTRDIEPEDDPGRSDMMPFSMEDAVMTIYDGCPLRGGIACST